jgi:predicted KAP-like P-loop ATPase
MWDIEDISICKSKEAHQTYMVTENPNKAKIQKIYKVGANKWKVLATIAKGLAVDVILGASAFKAIRVIINGAEEKLTKCGKTLHLNKDIFLYKSEILKPGESKIVLRNTNEKDSEIHI